MYWHRRRAGRVLEIDPSTGTSALIGDELPGGSDPTAIGLLFDGVSRTFRNKPCRVWRLYFAIGQLIKPVIERLAESC